MLGLRHFEGVSFDDDPKLEGQNKSRRGTTLRAVPQARDWPGGQWKMAVNLEPHSFFLGFRISCARKMRHPGLAHAARGACRKTRSGIDRVSLDAARGSRDAV